MSRFIPLIGNDRNTNTLHAERVSLAHQVLSGIPLDRMNLDRFYAKNQSVDTPLCGTIACGAGWLALHPDFQAMGLKVRPACGFRDGIEFGKSTMQLGGFTSLTKVFVHGDWQKGYELVNNMFDGYSDGVWDYQLMRHLGADETLVITHKALLLARLRYAYQHHCGRVAA